MTGVNDQNDEVLTLPDAHQLASFAAANHGDGHAPAGAPMGGNRCARLGAGGRTDGGESVRPVGCRRAHRWGGIDAPG